MNIKTIGTVHWNLLPEWMKKNRENKGTVKKNWCLFRSGQANDNTIITTTQSFRKIYLSLYLKGLCVSWRPNRTATFWTPPPISVVSFSFSRVAQPEARGPTLLDAGSLYRILSPTRLVSKLTDFRLSPSYIIVQRPFLLVGVTIALIQPIHGQGYNILIDRTHLLFTKIHFLFWLPSRVIGQYTTLTYVTVRFVYWYERMLVGCLDLWHINLSRLCSAKSIFIQIISSFSNNSV